MFHILCSYNSFETGSVFANVRFKYFCFNCAQKFKMSQIFFSAWTRAQSKAYPAQ